MSTTPTAGVEAKALNLHNAYRSKHGVSPLIWSNLLEKAAREYASDLISKNAKVVSKSDVPYGQNLFELRSQKAGTPAVADALGALESAIQTWYKGREDYDWGGAASSSTSAVGSSGLSFSQIVWRTTERLGVGIAHSYDKSKYVIVAFYDPPGNCSGEFSSNVYREQDYPASPASSQLPSNNGQLRSTNDLFNSLNISGDNNTSTSEESSSSRVERTIHIQTSSSTWSSDSSQNQENTQQNSSQNSQQLQIENSGNSKISGGQPGGQPTGQIYPGATPSEITGLELHNQLRRKHGVKPLDLDKKLCESANIQAKTLLSGVKAAGHVGVVGVGQNVYQMTGGAPPSQGKDVASVAVKKAVESWYSHNKEYNFEAPLQSGKYAGLFTQIVWRDSDKLGVGTATRGDLTIVVCLYSNQGNLANEKSHLENVSRASS